jgi:preprotein translocase subunit SecG
MIGGLIMTLLFLTALFLILLVLVQRGRGGGLAGAFGGMGGQSAFGTKAGDLFTRITIVTATFWIILCAASVKYFSEGSRTPLAPGLGKNAQTPENTSAAQPATDAKSDAKSGAKASTPEAAGTPAGGETAPAAAPRVAPEPGAGAAEKSADEKAK